MAYEVNDHRPSHQLLTAGEAAAYLRVSKATVVRWCCSGKLPAFKLGRGWRIHWDRLQELISSGINFVGDTLPSADTFHESDDS